MRAAYGEISWNEWGIRLLCTIVLLPVSCGESESKETSVAGKFSDRMEGCELVVEVRRPDNETLQLAYTFSNRTDEDAYLFNVIYRGIRDGVYQSDPNIVYVELGEKRAIISKKIIAVPRGLDVERPVVPCVTKVAAGKEFSETISLKLPLKAFTPYLHEPPVKKDQKVEEPASEEVDASFELGFFLTREGGSLAKEVETTAGNALLFNPFTYAKQKILKIGPLDESISVVPPRKR